MSAENAYKQTPKDVYTARRAVAAKLPTPVKLPLYLLDGVIHWLNSDSQPGEGTPLEKVRKAWEDSPLPYAIRHTRKLLNEEPR